MRREDPKYAKRRQEFMAKQKAMSKDKFSKGGLKGNQKKLDKNNNNRIDAQDFKILKAEKAKGRGMGLQDEKVKPGKVMKAKRGMESKLNKFAKKKGLPATMGKKFGKTIGVFPLVKDDDSFSKKMELQEKGVIDKKTGTGRERVAKAVKSTRVGKILLPIVGAGVAAHQFLKSKMKKKDKKMGGGMMKKYSKGGGADMGSKKSNESKTSSVKLIERSLKELKGDVKGSLKPFLKKRKEKNTVMEGSNVALSKVSPRMGGGIMKKPMGYKEGRSISTRGGGVDSSYLGRLRDIGAKGGFKRIPIEPEGGFKARPGRGSKKANLRSKARSLLLGVNPVTSALSTVNKLSKNLKNKNRNTANKAPSIGTSGSKNRPTIIDKDSRNPNPKTPKMYVGGSVSVKTKLGRNRPTKLY